MVRVAAQPPVRESVMTPILPVLGVALAALAPPLPLFVVGGLLFVSGAGFSPA